MRDSGSGSTTPTNDPPAKRASTRTSSRISIHSRGSKKGAGTVIGVALGAPKIEWALQPFDFKLARIERPAIFHTVWRLTRHRPASFHDPRPASGLYASASAQPGETASLNHKMLLAAQVDCD